MEQNSTIKGKKQSFSVHFQNTPSAEQLFFIYRNALNDVIHKKVLEQIQNTNNNI
ncbi:hypothetical protein ACFSO7_21815 [Bacillus sp. CGMCC 1.16607]|uniref:hypothetical protein n=1 Tax=Bacillus sp. CGMCC 1.16607 TaxID=3351842 RepID=UPI003626B766